MSSAVRHYRKSPRRPILLTVQFTRESSSAFFRKVGFVSDLGLSGAFIQTENPPDLGERVHLEFQIPSAWQTFVISGVVRWHAEENHANGFGVQFDGLRREQSEALYELMKVAGYLDSVA